MILTDEGWEAPGSAAAGPSATRVTGGTITGGGQWDLYSVRTPSAPTSPWSAPISMLPGRAWFRPPMACAGAAANDNNAGEEALGRSRGGLSTKIYLLANRRCRPVTRRTTSGQHGDCPRFIQLLDSCASPAAARDGPAPGRAER